MQDTAQKLKYADVQIQGLKMAKGLSESTLKEIGVGILTACISHIQIPLET